MKCFSIEILQFQLGKMQYIDFSIDLLISLNLLSQLDTELRSYNTKICDPLTNISYINNQFSSECKKIRDTTHLKIKVFVPRNHVSIYGININESCKQSICIDHYINIR